MTNEEKELLLKDLSARLPYGVKVLNETYSTSEIYTLMSIDDGYECLMKETYEQDSCCYSCNTNYSIEHYDGYLEYIKPYLRPMSSMTDEEKEHLQLLHNIITDENYEDGYSPAAWNAISEFNDYCNAHHLDNRGLIGKGLALEAPEQMYD